MSTAGLSVVIDAAMLHVLVFVYLLGGGDVAVLGLWVWTR